MPEQTQDIKPCPGCGKPIRKRSKLCAHCHGSNTPEAREEHSLCGALKRDGQACRNYAGFRTDHPRVGACHLHGGNSPTHQKAAAMVEARTQMAALGEPLPDDTRPTEMLLWLSRTIGGHVKSMLSDPESADFSTEVGRAKFRLLMEQVDRAARLAKQCSEANAEQVEANVKASQAALVARMVHEAARRAGLNDKQVAALGVGLRALTFEAQGDTAAAEDEAQRLAELREEIAADDQRRIEAEAQRLTGLVPASEIAPGEDTAWLESEPSPVAPPASPRRAPQSPAPPRRPARPTQEIRTNYKSDAPDTRDPLFKPL
jgi:hypothetical protein